MMICGIDEKFDEFLQLAYMYMYCLWFFFLFQGKRQESVPIFFCYWFDFDQGMLMPWIGEILTKRNDELKIEYLKDCLIQVH